MSTIFELIGYEETSPDTLTLQTPFDENRVLVMGFELYLAHTQLHILQNTQHLTAEYSMEEIMEAWLNTTGSLLDIREWLEGNKLTTEMATQSVSSISTDIPEKNRSDLFTIGHHFLYDKNGRRIDKPTSSQFSMNLAGRNWNNIQRGSQLESGLSSLPTVNISDVNLYGEHDHSASKDIGKKSHLHAIGDSGDYVQLENKYLHNMPQEGHNTTCTRGEQVVARGGRAGVVEKIWERRSTTYSSPASAITLEGIANEKPTQEPMIVETSAGVLCAICFNLPAYRCRACGVNVCSECLHKLPRFPCVETRHDGHDLIDHEVSYV